MFYHNQTDGTPQSGNILTSLLVYTQLLNLSIFSKLNLSSIFLAFSLDNLLHLVLGLHNLTATSILPILSINLKFKNTPNA